MEFFCQKCGVKLKARRPASFCAAHKHLSPSAKEAKRAYDRRQNLLNPNRAKEKNARLRKAVGETEWAERTRSYQRKYHCGVTREWVEAARAKQGGSCALCPRTLELERGREELYKECVDHCHATGEPRALLCSACNISLGMYERAQRAAGLRIEPYELYLTRFLR